VQAALPLWPLVLTMIFGFHIKIIGNKSKNKYVRQHKKVLQRKENNQQNKRRAYRLGENIYIANIQ
jgi:hypothetical protein